ncbi:MAG: TadE/TadG family type IV pilus assembly protein [Candidatus Sericytochromatia bacterium]|nr:TadE/TadG family type IV pilus assembly protein [Candidatus Sericytochromatia bacterium]
MIEVALALPLLLLLVRAVMGLGQVHAAGLALIHASREGARALAVGRPAPAVVAEVRRQLAPVDPKGQVQVVLEGERSEPGEPVRVVLEWAYPSPFAWVGLGEPLPLHAMATMRRE